VDRRGVIAVASTMVGLSTGGVSPPPDIISFQ